MTFFARRAKLGASNEAFFGTILAYKTHDAFNKCWCFFKKKVDVVDHVDGQTLPGCTGEPLCSPAPKGAQ